MAAAQREAATLVKAAEDSAGAALTAYAEVWAAAHEAGWSWDELGPEEVPRIIGDGTIGGQGRVAGGSFTLWLPA